MKSVSVKSYNISISIKQVSKVISIKSDIIKIMKLVSKVKSDRHDINRDKQVSTIQVRVKSILSRQVSIRDR